MRLIRMKKTSIFLALLIIFMSLPMLAYALDAVSIPGTYEVTSEVVAEFQVTEHPKSEQILEVFQSF